MVRVTLYHRTGSDSAEAILLNGFRDGRGMYMLDLDEPLEGVFLSVDPFLGDQEIPDGKILAVTFPEGFDPEQYAIVEGGMPVREYLMPAVVANGATIQRWDEPEDDEVVSPPDDDE